MIRLREAAAFSEAICNPLITDSKRDCCAPKVARRLLTVLRSASRLSIAVCAPPVDDSAALAELRLRAAEVEIEIWSLLVLLAPIWNVRLMEPDSSEVPLNLVDAIRRVFSETSCEYSEFSALRSFELVALEA